MPTRTLRRSEGFADAPDVARLLEAIENDGDAAGGEAAALGEEAGGHGPEQFEQIEKLHVGGVQAKFIRNALAEQAGAGDKKADRADEGREELGIAVCLTWLACLLYKKLIH